MSSGWTIPTQTMTRIGWTPSHKSVWLYDSFVNTDLTLSLWAGLEFKCWALEITVQQQCSVGPGPGRVMTQKNFLFITAACA